MRPPGFEPGFPALSFVGWEAGVIDQAARQIEAMLAIRLWTTAARPMNSR